MVGLRVALRNLWRSPRFTLTAIAILAMGLGGALAMFGAFQRLLLQKPPYPASERLYQIGPGPYAQGESRNCLLSKARTSEMLEALPGVEAVGFYEFRESLRLERGDSLHRLNVVCLDPAMQAIMGPRMKLGRPFDPDSFLNEEGVILTHRFWKQTLGSDPHVVGRRLSIERKVMDTGQSFRDEMRVQGVLASDFDLPVGFQVDVLRPMRKQAPGAGNYSNAIGWVRLNQGYSAIQVEPLFQAAGRHLAEREPLHKEKLVLSLIPIRQIFSRKADGTFMLICSMTGLLLILAFSNVTSMFLARTSDRIWDAALCHALGASTSRLFRGYFLQALLLACAAGGLGLGLAAVLSTFLQDGLPTHERLPGLATAWANPMVVLAAVILVLMLGSGIALVSLLRMLRMEPARWLQTAGRTFSTQSRMRNALAVCQVALAFVMLWGASLMARSLWVSMHENLGYQSHQRILVQMEGERAQARNRPGCETLLASLRTHPGIEGAGMAQTGLTGFHMATSFTLGDDPTPKGMIRLDAITPGWLEAVGISILQGRSFQPGDERRKVCIIDNATARTFWPGGALGQRILNREIVGVIRGYAGSSMQPLGPLFLECRTQPMDELYLHTKLSTSDVQSLVKQVLAQHDPTVKISSVQALDDLRWATLRTPRQLMSLLVAFALLSAILAGSGLGALLWDNVNQRKRELAIRSALGDSPARQALRMTVFGLKRTVIGLMLGSVLVGILARVAEVRLAGLARGISLLDPLALGLAVGFLLLMALLSVLGPVLQVVHLDPAVALRE